MVKPVLRGMLAVLMGFVVPILADAPSSRAVAAPKSHEVIDLLTAGATGAWPSGLDPATNATSGANISIMNAIFGGLFQLTANPDGSSPHILGVLAERFEIKDEGRTLLIHLRPGVRFSDGTALDGQALYFNLNRDLTTPCACAPSRWPWVDKTPVTLVDPLTVALHFSRPFPAAINNLPISNLNWPASPSALKTLGDAAFRLAPVGAGPFKVLTDELSTKLVLVRNPAYWESGAPHLEKLTFVPSASDQASYLALLSGNAQIAEGVTSVQVIDQARKAGKLAVFEQPPTSPLVIQLNTAAAPFNDQRAREALYYATDVDALRKGIVGDRFPASESFTASGGLFYQATVPGYRRYDLQKAKALVKQLGGLKVHLGTLQGELVQRIVTALQTQWRNAGIEVVVEDYELATLVKAYQARQWQAMLQTAGAYDPEAATGVTTRFRSGGLFSGVNDTQLDSILADAGATVDAQARSGLYLKAAIRISDNAYAPFLFAYSPAQISVKGISGPGLTTRIPAVGLSTGILWQDVRMEDK